MSALIASTAGTRVVVDGKTQKPAKTREDLAHTPSPYYSGAKEQTHRLPDGSLKSSVDEEWERSH
jgi:hypothetical protein